MAIAYCILGSGSGGNSLFVEGGGVTVLVDCGFSPRRLQRRLAAVGRSLREVDAVLVTHGHGDHAGGAAALGRRAGIDVWATPGTWDMIRGRVPASRVHRLPVHGRIAVGGLVVETVPTVHDAPGSVALVLRDGETALGVVTDLGIPTEQVARRLEGVDALVLETNHDEEMLLYGPYPARLKRRIRGDLGHLSNAQAAQLLRAVVHPGLLHLTLAHLSETNNTPEKARLAIEPVLKRAGVRPAVSIAAQDGAGSVVSLGGPRRGQLALPLW